MKAHCLITVIKICFSQSPRPVTFLPSSQNFKKSQQEGLLLDKILQTESTAMLSFGCSPLFSIFKDKTSLFWQNNIGREEQESKYMITIWFYKLLYLQTSRNYKSVGCEKDVTWTSFIWLFILVEIQARGLVLVLIKAFKRI